MKELPITTPKAENALGSLPSPWDQKTNNPTRKPIALPDWAQIGPQTIQFTVHHEPMGAPRMTQRDKWKGRACVERYHALRDAIRRDAPPLPEPEQIDSLSWVAYFTPPESWSRKRREEAIGTRHRVKPDRDNIDKAILDALFERDERISDSEWIRKRWGVEACIKITIVTM